MNPTTSHDRSDTGVGSLNDADDAGRQRRLEFLAALIITVVGAMMVGYTARQWWFHADAWDFLTTRSLTDPASLLRDHAGHWQTPTVIAYLVIQGVVGMRFWPLYYLPRVIGYAAWCLWLWRVLRRRGTHPAAALSFLALSLVLAVSDWHDLSTIGNLIVLSSALAVGLLSVDHQSDVRRERITLFGLLLLALASSGLGIALLGGTALVAASSTAKVRRWWPSILGAGALYAAWYVVFRSSGPTSIKAIDGIVGFPSGAFGIAQNAVAELTGVSAIAALLTVVIIAAIVILAVRRQLDSFDHLMIFTLLIWLAMVVIYRVGPGAALPTATRYAHNVIFLLTPVLLPKLAPSRAPARSIAVAIILVALMPANWTTLVDRINFWERRAQASREVVESAAFLMAAGEPWLADSPVDPPRAGMLTTTRLDELLESGWSTELSPDRDDVQEARATLRYAIRPTGLVQPPLPTVVLGREEGSCVVAVDGSIILNLRQGSTLSVSAESGPLEITWIDRWGLGLRSIRGDMPEFVLITLDPESTATLELHADPLSSMSACS